MGSCTHIGWAISEWSEPPLKHPRQSSIGTIILDTYADFPVADIINEGGGGAFETVVEGVDAPATENIYRRWRAGFGLFLYT